MLTHRMGRGYTVRGLDSELLQHAAGRFAQPIERIGLIAADSRHLQQPFELVGSYFPFPRDDPPLTIVDNAAGAYFEVKLPVAIILLPEQVLSAAIDPQPRV